MGHSKSALRKRFMVMNAYVKEKERSQINKLLYASGKYKKKKKTTKAKVGRRKEIIKTRAE